MTWKKSAIGYRENQKRTIKALGLKRLGHTVELPDNRAVRGMINTVRHLVEISDDASATAGAGTD